MFLKICVGCYVEIWYLDAQLCNVQKTAEESSRVLLRVVVVGEELL